MYSRNGTLDRVDAVRLRTLGHLPLDLKVLRHDLDLLFVVLMLDEQFLELVALLDRLLLEEGDFSR